MDGDEMDIDVPLEDGEVVNNGLAPTKVHIRGLNNLHTSDVEAYVQEHFDPATFLRVEWIDDTSANIHFDHEDAAMSALLAFAVDHEPSPESHPLHLRPAKPLHTSPDIELFVRMAQITDVKVQNAAAQSRYYLMHPEHDPSTRRGRGGRGGGGRMRGHGYRRGEYRHTRDSDDGYDDESPKERAFDESLYDDNPQAIAAYRARSRSPQPRRRPLRNRSRSPVRRPRSRAEVELFPSGSGHGRLRDRSASPLRDGDGRYGFKDEQPARHMRRRTPPVPLRSGTASENYAAASKVRELFPNKVKQRNAAANRDVIELFPDKISAPEDLFAEKLAASQAARKYRHDLSTETLTAAMERPRRPQRPRRGEDLFPTTKSERTAGRLNSTDDGFSIKGAGQGFSFKGAAR